MKRLCPLCYKPVADNIDRCFHCNAEVPIDPNYLIRDSLRAGYNHYVSKQDADVLEIFPVDQLYLQDTSKPRHIDWQKRWNKARESLGSKTTATLATSQDGPFLALKNDPIWRKLSAFDRPYPPFDYEDVMWVRHAEFEDVDYYGFKQIPKIVKIEPFTDL